LTQINAIQTFARELIPVNVADRDIAQAEKGRERKIMGFYIRKAISRGPFRFNLSRSGIGLSVGVKGFRLGSGPRGNYVHMGRKGLYYRASLGGAYRSLNLGSREPNREPSMQPPAAAESIVPIEESNVLEMVSANGSDIVRQINEKMALIRFWP
jgi:hypothetical protein